MMSCALTPPHQRAHIRHHGIYHYCVICKKAGMPERKYISHSADDCTGVRTNRPIKYGMVIPMGIRNEAVKQYNKPEKYLRKELKALKNHNKMLYRITKKYGSCCDIKKIKKIREKASKKTRKSSRDDSDSDSLLASDSS